jgi:hypothetical protein
VVSETGVIEQSVMAPANTNNQISGRRNVRLRRFINALRKAYEKEQQQLQEKVPGIPPRIGPGWPRTTFGPNVSRVREIISTAEDSQKRLVQRLKTFQYPYPEGNKGKKTFMITSNR